MLIFTKANKRISLEHGTFTDEAAIRRGHEPEVRMRRMVLFTLFSVVLLSRSALAQGPRPNDSLIGDYRGFAQSLSNVDLRMPMALTVDRTDGSEFFGHLTLGPAPFAFQGKVEDSGQFKGRGSRVAGEVTFTGTVQDFGVGGLLARSTYKFTPATGGRADQGIADFIRAPFQPPDPAVPVGGTYVGSYVSHLGRGPATLRLELLQEGTSLTGQLFLDDGTATVLSWQIVGGIQPCVVVGGIQPCTVVGGIAPCVVVGATSPCVEILLIGAGSAGRLVAGGSILPPSDDGFPLPDDEFNAVLSLEFLGGGVDLAKIAARR